METTPLTDWVAMTSSLDGGATISSSEMVQTPTTAHPGRTGFEGVPGDDLLNTVDGMGGNDTADGGAATDTCEIDAGDETSNCESVVTAEAIDSALVLRVTGQGGR